MADSKPSSPDLGPSAAGVVRGHGPRLTDTMRWTICLAAYGAIAVASLAPKAMRPTTGVVPGAVEHFFAYFVLGVVAGYLLRGQISRRRLGLFTAGYAGLLEAGQFAVPGRVPAFLDFAASTLGALMGLLLLVTVLRFFRGR